MSIFSDVNDKPVAEQPTPPKATAQWEQIDPAQAQELLDSLHPDQRHNTPGPTARYAADMRGGNWREDAYDPIMIDWDGHLIDGQHRMLAIIESGTTINFFTVRGCDPALMAVKDTGKSRSVADSLKVAGLGRNLTGPELRTASFIAKQVIKWDSHQYLRSASRGHADPTNSQVAERIILQPDILAAAQTGVEASRSIRPPIIVAGIYGFFYLLVNRLDSMKATEFHQEFLFPDAAESGSAVLALRERLWRSKNSTQEGVSRRSRDHLNPDEQLALCIRAWNRRVIGKRTNIKKLQVSRGPLSNSNFPQPYTPEQAKQFKFDDDE